MMIEAPKPLNKLAIDAEASRILLNENKRVSFDPSFQMNFIKVFPGEYYVTKNMEEMIVTTLGSCVAACIRDPVARIGGMNHFMLPESDSHQWGAVSAAYRYGNFAMERLINEIISKGGSRQRLEIKIFGGANVIQTNRKIGEDNCKFILRYLEDEGLPVDSSNLGGNHARRVHYFPKDGRVLQKRIQSSITKDLAEKEAFWGETLYKAVPEGDVELFT